MASSGAERPPRIPEIEPPRRPVTLLERSLWPSCLSTLIVMLVVMLLLRVRLPPLPYSLLIVGGIWVACFIAVFLWQVHGRRAGRR